jgi:hypothetical protein
MELLRAVHNNCKMQIRRETRANRGLNKTPSVITRARQAAAGAAPAVSSERGCGASIPAGERSRVRGLLSAAAAKAPNALQHPISHR